jgi:hypothetical protein
MVPATQRIDDAVLASILRDLLESAATWKHGDAC